MTRSDHVALSQLTVIRVYRPRNFPLATPTNLYWPRSRGSELMLRAAVIVLMLALSPSHAWAEARIALLIGNQVYSPKVGQLRNPHADVALVAVALKQLGFHVTILKDADYRTMDVAVKRFITEVRSKGRGAISFFYYTGHGAANPDTQINYLIPTDVTDPNDGNLWYQSFQQNDLIDRLSKQAPNATHTWCSMPAATS